MIKAAYILVLGLASFQVAGAESEPDVCAASSNIAKAVMTARQSGGVLPDLMQRATSMNVNPLVLDITKKLLLAAFEVPEYSDPKLQRAAIVAFQNQTYLECSKGTL